MSGQLPISAASIRASRLLRDHQNGRLVLNNGFPKLPVIRFNPDIITTFSVKGRVFLDTGVPLAGRLVKAVDVDVRSERLLGTTITAADGSYTITYTSAQLKQPSNATADLKLYAYDSGSENTVVRSTEITWNAEQDATVDIVVETAVSTGITEFSVIKQTILHALGTIKPEEAVEDDAHKDFTYLVNTTGIDRTRIEQFVSAYKQQATTNLDPETLYGLYRQGQSPDATILLGRSSQLLKRSLQLAAGSNVVSSKTDVQLADMTKAVKIAAINHAIQPPGSTTMTPLGAVLSTATANPKLLLQLYADSDSSESPHTFWDSLDSHPEFSGKSQSIQQAINLGAMTLSYLPLIRELQGQLQSNALQSLEELAKFSPKQWQAIVQKPEIGVPAEIPGADPEEKARAYSSTIASIVEARFPARYVMHRLEDPDTEDVEELAFLPERPQMLQFLQRNQNFDFTTTRVSEYIANNPTATNGIENPDAVKDAVSSLQRVYSLADSSWTQARPLLAGGIRSAQQISRMGRSSFLARFRLTLGTEALHVFERSEQISASAIHMLSEFGNWGQLPLPILHQPKLSYDDVQAIVPDIATLFGNQDTCSCSSCKSIDGPAAYLVDILHFLSDRKLIDPLQTTRDRSGNITKVVIKKTSHRTLPVVIEMSAKEALFERRPDIGAIELSCQNTNTVMPYIDLALEVLENAVSPMPAFKNFILPGTLITDFDKQIITASTRALFDPSLSEFATVTVTTKGSTWTIDEVAFTYSLKKTGINVEVIARSLQTKGTAAERATTPMYTNSEAYAILKEQVYPWNLPFDQPAETVRTYLLHMNVKRHEAMEVFDGSARNTILTRQDIACERFGITPNEATIITGLQTSQRNSTNGGIWNFWGLYSDQLNDGNTIANPTDKFGAISEGPWVQTICGRIDVLLQQSGLGYPELLNLLQFSDVLGATGRLTINTVRGADADTCDLSKLQLVGANDQVLQSIHRFVRLLRKLNNWTIIDLGCALHIFKQWNIVQGANAILVSLSHVDRLREILDLPIITILSFWLPLSTIAYQDHENDNEDKIPISEFARIFCNPTVIDKREAVFTGQPEALNGKLTDHTPVLSAALGLSSADVIMLMSETNVAAGETLTIASTSILYRHSVLANALGLSVPEYLTLLKLHGMAPFADTLHTISFVERTLVTLESGELSIAELNYLLRHDFNETSGLHPSEENIAQKLDELRSALRKIQAENTLEIDATNDLGDLTKSKLALLNWDSDMIAEIFAVLNDTRPYSTSIASALPDTFLPAAAVKDKFTYDDTHKTVSYSRVMTKADKDALLQNSLSTTEDFKDAIEALYLKPRDILFRNMRTFTLTQSQTHLDAIPSTVTIPSNVKKRMEFNAITKTLSYRGVMSEAERDMLLANTNSDADASYINAINSIFTLPTSMGEPTVDGFITQSEIFGMFDPVGTDSVPVSSHTRFSVVLEKLLPKLRNVLSQRHLTQFFSQELGVDVQIAEALLQRLAKVNNHPVVELFSQATFLQASPSTTLSPTTFPDHFNAISLLKKLALLVTRFNLTLVELGWLYDFETRESNLPSQWLNLNALPVHPLPAGVLPNLIGWERVSALLKLRDVIPGGDKVLQWVFTNIHGWEDTSDKFVEVLCAHAKWPTADVKLIVGSSGLNLPFPESFKSETGLNSIIRCLQLLRKIGCSAIDAVKYTKAEQSEVEARAVVQTVKAKYDQGSWAAVGRPLRNIIREGQRKALVAHLLARQSSASLGWRNASDISAYYLIDVEMGPCQLTSRIKQAISSTQTFVQRCIMNLEKEVVVDTEWDSRWEEWDTLKSFSLTSAARKVFMRPENYLDPAVRDDKTPFFKELEEELQQNELTHDIAEQALLNYLDKLETVSHLQVVSFYHQQEGENPRTMDTLHVFAKSCSQPPAYYYRKRVQEFEWTAWEKIEVEVSGDHLIPVIWRRRLYLFWAQFIERHGEGKVSPQEVVSGGKYWDCNLAWSERKNGKWLAKTTTTASLLLYGERPFSIETTDTVENRGQGTSLYTFRTEGGGAADFLRVRCMQNTLYYPFMGYFHFEDMKTEPFVVEQWRPLANEPPQFPTIGVLEPMGTEVWGMGFREVPLNTGGGDHGLTVYTNKFSTAPDKQDVYSIGAQTIGQDAELLVRTPGTYNLLSAHQERLFGGEHPFFFQHSKLSFFVEPMFEERRRDFNLHIPLSELEGTKFKSHFDKVATVAPSNPVKGLVDTIDSFEILHGTTRNVFQEATAPLAIRHGIESRNSTLTAANVSLGINGSGRMNRPTASATRTTDLGRTVETENLRLRLYLGRDPIKQYKFSVFYHPFISEFIRHLNRDGVEALMSRPLQLSSNPTFFEDSYGKRTNHVHSKIPIEEVEMDNGAMSQYNWELFYHVPLLIAEKLSKNQRFAEAQKWFHFIFDPTDKTSGDAPQRFWRMKKFFQTSKEEIASQSILSLFKFLASRGSGNNNRMLSTKESERLDMLQQAISMWRSDPFNPYLIARTRSAAFQISVVMKYLDNLIAWGDQLFRMDTMESINEATQIFALASDILGKRPVEIPPRAEPEVQTFDSIEPRLDGMSNFNALQKIEELIPPLRRNFLIKPKTRRMPATPTIMYFCVPKNEKLLGYYDIVSDRLFKIRNCMNLQGIVRELALFEPPLDPAMLIKASAAGVDLGSVLSDVNAPLSHHRYNVMVARALEFCNELQQLGVNLLAALEKRDSEAVSLLHSTQALQTLKAAREVKKLNIDETKETIIALEKTKETMQATKDYYSSRLFMNDWETNQLRLQNKAISDHDKEAWLHMGASASSLLPDFKVGGPTTIGATWGGSSLAAISSHTASYMSIKANKKATQAGMSSTIGGYVRRFEEWHHQASLADKQIVQVDQQIMAAKIRQKIAETELKNHDLQAKNAQEYDDYIKAKFTNKSLYDWMIGQVSTVYFQSYQIAYDTAKRAERAYAFELGLEKGDFIQFGYWDSLKKGLMAGSKLAHDLRRMNMSYLELDRREYEITRSISLSQLDPVAFIQLKTTGSCYFTVPEQIFDIDFPGHYFRRLKTVSLSIPSLVGPYTALSSTLTLLRSSIRTSPTLSNNNYSRRDNDVRFKDMYTNAQSIVTSSAQDDAGIFNVNFQDERYLPFERAGVISTWNLQFPPIDFCAFDIGAIPDIMLHFKYTAREAGESLRSQAVKELRKTTLDAIGRAEGANGLARMFSLKREYPDAWHRFFHKVDTGPQETPLALVREKFSFLLRGAKSLTFVKADIFVRLKTGSKLESLRAYFSEDAETELGRPIQLMPWNTCLRGAKPIGKPEGVYKLRLEQDSGLVLEKDIEDIVIVVQYQVKWESQD